MITTHKCQFTVHQDVHNAEPLRSHSVPYGSVPPATSACVLRIPTTVFLLFIKSNVLSSLTTLKEVIHVSQKIFVFGSLIETENLVRSRFTFLSAHLKLRLYFD